MPLLAYNIGWIRFNLKKKKESKGPFQTNNDRYRRQFNNKKIYSLIRKCTMKKNFYFAFQNCLLHIELSKTAFTQRAFQNCIQELLCLNSKENKLTLCNLLLCMAARRSKIKHTFQAANRMSSLKTNRLSKYNNMGLVIYVCMEENKDLCFKFISIEYIFCWLTQFIVYNLKLQNPNWPIWAAFWIKIFTS